MTSDLDIYRTASVLIGEHGDETDLVAAQRADNFIEAGETWTTQSAQATPSSRHRRSRSAISAYLVGDPSTRTQLCQD